MNLLEIKVALEELRRDRDQDLEAHEWSARLLRKAYEISLDAGQYYETVGEFCRPIEALLVVNRMLTESWSLANQAGQAESPSTIEPQINLDTRKPSSQPVASPTIVPGSGVQAGLQPADVATQIAEHVKAAFDYASARVSRAELAKLAGVSERTIDRRTGDGTLTAHRVGRRVTYDRIEALKALSNGHNPNPR